MRILHVTASMDPALGGVSQAVRTLVKATSDICVENEVVSIDDPEASVLWNDAFTVHALGSQKKNLWNYNTELVPWLKANMGVFNVVIVHGLWLHHSFAVKKVVDTFNGNNKPKVFVMPHGMLDPYFQKARGRRLKAIRNYFYWNIIESGVINSADGLLFTCELEKQLAATTFKRFNPKKEFVVSLGIPAPPPYTNQMYDAFRATSPLIINQSYFLFLGRIHIKKGVDILLKGYEKVFSDLAGINIPKLVIAGPGIESEYGKEILAMVNNSLILTENVYFTGMLTGNAKWGALYHSQAFILPSHQENFGIAVAEALACSKPVLISNQVNIWREIEAESAGLIGDDTLDGVIAVLEKWIKLSPHGKKAMENAAHSCYSKNFAVEYSALRFLKAIKS